MKCTTREIRVTGVEYNEITRRLVKQEFTCYCTNDELGKTLSIDNGVVQFTIPFDELAKYFIGDYTK